VFPDLAVNSHHREEKQWQPPQEVPDGSPGGRGGLTPVDEFSEWLVSIQEIHDGLRMKRNADGALCSQSLISL